MMLANYPDTFAAVQIYVGCAYATAWGDTRAAFYAVGLTPWAVFDGGDVCAGAYPVVESQYLWYEQTYLDRRAIPTDVTIQLSADPLAEQTYRVTARVCLEPAGEAKTVRLQLVQLLDHYPLSPDWCRHGFKQAATSASLDLTPGDCEIVQCDFTFDADSWAAPDNIRIVAWAQEPQTASPPEDPAEIHQAATIRWPLPSDCNANGVPDPDDIAACDGSAWCADCNANGVPDECDLAAGTSLDVDDTGVPDECEVGDVNCDGLVNAFDIDPFVVALTDPSAYLAAYPECHLGRADCNHDTTLDAFDIDPFIALLTGP